MKAPTLERWNRGSMRCSRTTRSGCNCAMPRRAASSRAWIVPPPEARRTSYRRTRRPRSGLLALRRRLLWSGFVGLGLGSSLLLRRRVFFRRLAGRGCNGLLRLRAFRLLRRLAARGGGRRGGRVLGRLILVGHLLAAEALAAQRRIREQLAAHVERDRLRIGVLRHARV